MAPRRLHIPRTLAVVVVGAGAAVALALACDQPVTPDPVDAGRLEKTSDAHPSDGSHQDASPKPDASTATHDAQGTHDAPPDTPLS